MWFCINEHIVQVFFNTKKVNNLFCHLKKITNNSPMSCFKVILTWGVVIFVNILHRAIVRCNIITNIMPCNVFYQIFGRDVLFVCQSIHQNSLYVQLLLHFKLEFLKTVHSCLLLPYKNSDSQFNCTIFERVVALY